MIRSIVLASAVGIASLGILAGCDDENAATKQKADNAADSAARNAEALKDSAKTIPQDASKEVKDAAAEAAKKADKVAAGATAAVESQAQSLFDKAMGMVKDRKWTDAEALADQLDQLKGQLSPEWAGKIDQVRAAIKQGKASMPGN